MHAEANLNPRHAWSCMGASRQPRGHSVTCNNKVVAQPQRVELWSPWTSSCRSAPASTIRGNQAEAARHQHDSSVGCDPERIHTHYICMLGCMHECIWFTSIQFKKTIILSTWQKPSWVQKIMRSFWTSFLTNIDVKAPHIETWLLP